MIMDVTIKPYAEEEKTYKTNIPIHNILEIRRVDFEQYRFRLIDGSWTWYYVSDDTGREIENAIRNYDELH